MKTALSYNREAYRLWFEYLRVAHRDPRDEVREALRRSKDYYDRGVMSQTRSSMIGGKRSGIFLLKSMLFGNLRRASLRLILTP